MKHHHDECVEDCSDCCTPGGVLRPGDVDKALARIRSVSAADAEVLTRWVRSARMALDLLSDPNSLENGALLDELEQARAEVEQLTEGNRVLHRHNGELVEALEGMLSQFVGIDAWLTNAQLDALDEARAALADDSTPEETR